MIQRDIDALTDRLFTGMDTDLLQTEVANQPLEEINKDEIWTRWVVLPGLSMPAGIGGPDALIETTGMATLQIFAPLGTFTAEAGEVRDQCAALFRQWRSDDRKLVVRSTMNETSTYKEAGAEYHLINVKVSWVSRRRASDI